MKELLVLAPLSWVLLFTYGGWLLRHSLSRPPGFARRLVMGIGWQAAWAVPVMIAQAAFMDIGIRGKLWCLYISWPVHCGGKTVTLLFESTVGDRRDVLMGNFLYFSVLTAVQMAALSVVYALRLRRTGKRTDPVLVALGVAVLLNALLNIRWPWWGT